MGPFLNIIQIIISITLIVLIIMQSKGGGVGSMFGGSDSSIYKTRRGVEKTLFNITIGMAVAFFIVAILNVIAAG